MITESLEDQVVDYVISNHGRFPYRVFDYFGWHRQDKVSAAIEKAVAEGRILRTWIDDRAMGGIRYSVLLPPEPAKTVD